MTYPNAPSAPWRIGGTMCKAFHMCMTGATVLLTWHWFAPNQYLAMGACVLGFIGLFVADLEEP